jgi:hypothetical protein
MAKAIPYYGGVPTKPDVDKLIEKWGIPEEGTQITYEQIETVLGIKRNGERSSRYRTVVSAWKKRLETEHDVFLFTDIGDPGDLVVGVSRKLAQSVNALKRGLELNDVSKTRRHELSEEQRKRHDHMKYIGVKYLNEIKEAKHLPSGK